MAGAAQKRTARRAATAAEIAAMQKAEFDAKRAAAAGMRFRPMVEEVMMAEEAPAGTTMRKGGKVKKKPMAVKKMAKGGSTASKRADGCATKGKTKGRFV
jgi:hypothetical protein